MSAIFSHIVQKHLSQENENVATEALAYILQSSEAAKSGIMRLLRGIIPELPELWFRTQQMEGNARPDMWGLDERASTHVFVENKFWAGLTDNQPVTYIKMLSELSHASLLLIVVPAARERSVWRELTKRLSEADIATEPHSGASGASAIIRTSKGPLMALSNWNTVLSFLEAETGEDYAARNDLAQLRALCQATDSNAFHPFSREEISDQRLPSFLLQLSGLVKDVSNIAFEEQILFRDSLTPQADAERIGRYANILSEKRCGVWLGIHLRLWKEYGLTPFWLVFSSTNFGRSYEVRNLLEPWSLQKGVFTAMQPDGSFVVAVDIDCGEERDLVVRSIVEQIAKVGYALESLPIRTSKAVPEIL